MIGGRESIISVFSSFWRMVFSGSGAARMVQTETDIEEAYQRGEITKKEYLELRIQFEKAVSGYNY